MVTVPVDVMLAACRGGLALSRAGIDGEGARQAAALSECLCTGARLTETDLLRLRGLLALAPDGGAVDVAQEAVGGDVARGWLFAAKARDELSASLGTVEETVAARIQGHTEAVFMAAIQRVGRKAADLVKRGGCRGTDPVVWLDSQPVGVVRAALLDLDEAKAADAVEDLGPLVGPVLDAAAIAVAAVLTKRLEARVDPERVMNQVQRDEALRVAKVFTLGLVMGRLARADDVVDATVPPNISRMVLAVAGGADATPAGGVMLSETGRVLVGGVESKGDGFATSQQVLEIVSPEATTELVWQHSGASDANEIHMSNDGRPLSECDFRAGPPGGPRGCGCRWEKVVVVP